jgi:putative membrane protein
VKSKPLILCIDRDNDIGRKTKYMGPIVGVKKNMEAARELGLADPTDTDVNALYAALKIAKDSGLDVVTLTGDEKVGLISDREIARQIDDVISKLHPSSIIFVSDGMDDEQVIPIIQSRARIDSVHRVVVRQSKELEKAYFKMANFIKEVTAEPELARLIFGLPGVIMILLAIGGRQALSLILGVIGAFLVIKGIGWEEEFFKKAGDFIRSISIERVSIVLYIVGLISFAVGAGFAYQDLTINRVFLGDRESSLNALGLFISNSNSLAFIMSGLGIVILARVIDDWKLKFFINIRRYFILAALVLVVWVLLDVIANYIVNEDFGFGNFILSVAVILASFATWIKLTEYFFKPEIDLIYKIMDEVQGKEVFDVENERIGRVRSSTVENLELAEIHTKRRTILREDIVSISEKIIVKAKA